MSIETPTNTRPDNLDTHEEDESVAKAKQMVKELKKEIAVANGQLEEINKIVEDFIKNTLPVTPTKTLKSLKEELSNGKENSPSCSPRSAIIKAIDEVLNGFPRSLLDKYKFDKKKDRYGQFTPKTVHQKYVEKFEKEGTQKLIELQKKIGEQITQTGTSQMEEIQTIHAFLKYTRGLIRSIIDEKHAQEQKIADCRFFIREAIQKPEQDRKKYIKKAQNEIDSGQSTLENYQQGAELLMKQWEENPEKKEGMYIYMTPGEFVKQLKKPAESKKAKLQRKLD